METKLTFHIVTKQYNINKPNVNIHQQLTNNFQKHIFASIWYLLSLKTQGLVSLCHALKRAIMQNQLFRAFYHVTMLFPHQTFFI